MSSKEESVIVAPMAGAGTSGSMLMKTMAEDGSTPNVSIIVRECDRPGKHPSPSQA